MAYTICDLNGDPKPIRHIIVDSDGNPKPGEEFTPFWWRCDPCNRPSERFEITYQSSADARLCAWYEVILPDDSQSCIETKLKHYRAVMDAQPWRLNESVARFVYAGVHRVGRRLGRLLRQSLPRSEGIMSLNPARITAIVDRVMANHGFRKEPAMHEDTLITNLGHLAAHAELEAARLDAEKDKGPSQITAAHVWRERAKAYRKAQCDVIHDVLPREPEPLYPFANVLPQRPAVNLDWTGHALLVVALLGLLFVAVR